MKIGPSVVVAHETNSAVTGLLTYHQDLLKMTGVRYRCRRISTHAEVVRWTRRTLSSRMAAHSPFEAQSHMVPLRIRPSRLQSLQPHLRSQCACQLYPRQGRLDWKILTLRL